MLPFFPFTQKLQHVILRQTGNIVYCLLSCSKKQLIILEGLQKQLRKSLMSSYFRQDKLDVWGNVLIKYLRNNESVYNL